MQIRKILRSVIPPIVFASFFSLTGCDEIVYHPARDFSGKVGNAYVRFERKVEGRFPSSETTNYMTVTKPDGYVTFIDRGDDLKVDETKSFGPDGLEISGRYRYGKDVALTASTMLFNWYLSQVFGEKQKSATLDNDPKYEWTLDFAVTNLINLSSREPEFTKLKLIGPFIKEESIFE